MYINNEKSIVASLKKVHMHIILFYSLLDSRLWIEAEKIRRFEN